MKVNKKRYTQLLLAGLLLGISISLLLNYKTNTRINQLEEVIELQERQIDSISKSQNNLINEFEKITQTIEEMYKQQAQ